MPRRLHRDPIVRRVAAILEMGRPTRFAFEGACRHGLRAARLCGSSTTWRAADKFAALVVELALHRLGATRPTWAQGQPELVDRLDRWTCLTCGGLLDVDTRWRYCSDECKAIGVGRSVEARLKADADAARLAFWAARARGECPERACDHCGEAFRLTIEGSRGVLQRYCSRACWLASKVVDRTRTCPVCRQTFRYKYKRQVYCSAACLYSTRSKRREIGAGHPGLSGL